MVIEFESILSSIALQQSEGILSTQEIKLTYMFCLAFPLNISRQGFQDYSSEEEQKL